MRYYLGPYEQRPVTPDLMAWEMPVGAVCGLDFRSNADIDTPGVALFAMPDDRPLGADYRLIGQGDIRDIVPRGGARGVFASALKVPAVTGDRLVEWVWDALTVRADPTGDARSRPIVPSSRGRMRLVLAGHGEVMAKRFTVGMPEAAPVVDMLQRQHRRNRQAALAGELKDAVHHRRILDYWGKKFGVSAPEDVFIPGDVPKERPVPHETTITESFNTADSDTLGPDLSWTELQGDFDIVSNVAELQSIAGSYGGIARADSDLSSDDHYVESTIHSNGAATFRFLMQIARKNSSTTLTYYIAYYRYSANNCQIYRSSSGSLTSVVGPTSRTLTDGTAYTARLTCDGSTISQSVDGTSVHSQTDATITGNVRCGIGGYQAAPGGINAYHDAFTAADLAAGPASAVPVLYHHRRMQGMS